MSSADVAKVNTLLVKLTAYAAVAPSPLNGELAKTICELAAAVWDIQQTSITAHQEIATARKECTTARQESVTARRESESARKQFAGQSNKITSLMHQLDKVKKDQSKKDQAQARLSGGPRSSGANLTPVEGLKYTPPNLAPAVPAFGGAVASANGSATSNLVPPMSRAAVHPQRVANFGNTGRTPASAIAAPVSTILAPSNTTATSASAAADDFLASLAALSTSQATPVGDPRLSRPPQQLLKPAIPPATVGGTVGAQPAAGQASKRKLSVEDVSILDSSAPAKAPRLDTSNTVFQRMLKNMKEANSESETQPLKASSPPAANPTAESEAKPTEASQDVKVEVMSSTHV